MKVLLVAFALVAVVAAQEKCECGVFLHDVNAIIPDVFTIGPVYEYADDSLDVANCEALSWYRCRKFCKDLWEVNEKNSTLDDPLSGATEKFGQVLCQKAVELVAEDGWFWEELRGAEVELWSKISPSCDYYGYVLEAFEPWRLCCDAQGNYEACS